MYQKLTHELCTEFRNMEPYRQLLAGEVKASILLAPHTNPFTGVFYSVRNGHFMLMLA